VVLLLPLSSAMDNGKFNHGGDGCNSGSGGSGGSTAAVAAAAVVAVDYRHRWWWCLMVAAALDVGHPTTSLRSKRVAQQENKRVVQGESMQQSANLPLRCH
jgi:hypothetical protein